MMKMPTARPSAGSIRRLAAASLMVLAVSLAFVASASAKATFEFKFGSEGTGAGQFNQVAGLAVNNADGKVYAADRHNHRIQVFNEAGKFLEAWGYDVVASGEDDKPLVAEVQHVVIEALGGTFKLTYQGQTTPPIPYNASPGAVETALNGLSTITSAGGVTVSGGPGDATGSNPYVVTFSGTFDRSQIEITRSGLFQPVGTTLECEFRSSSLWESEAEKVFRWIADGEPIAGATQETYTTTPADAGKPIQCEVEGIFKQFGVRPDQVAWETYGDYTVVGAPGPTAPPVPPAFVAEPEGPSPLTVGGPGGTLTCNAGSWGNAPDTYTYQWYLDYKPFGSPTTTASTSNQTTVTPTDVAGATAIQCRVTATNAGGSATMWSQLKLTSPGPQGFVIQMPNLNVVQLGRGTPTTTTTTKTQGGSVFEICKANPPSNDVCKAGVPGPGVGQFNDPRGVAVDNSPGGGGAVLVGDDNGYRVQKFTSSGEPILLLGGRVDQSTNEHACLISSGHDCGVGVKLRTNKLGFLRGQPCLNLGACETPNNGMPFLGNSVAVDPNDGTIYVNDPHDWWFDSRFVENRSLAYEPDGSIIGQMFMPFPLAPTKATSLTVDSQSRVLLTNDGDNAALAVRDISEYTPEGTRRPFPDRRYLVEDGAPIHVSADPDDDRIWYVDENTVGFFPPEPAQVCDEPETIAPRRALIAVDGRGRRLDCTVPKGLGSLPTAGGIVVTKNDLAFVSLLDLNTIKVYKLPQETAPTVNDVSVDQIASRSAMLHADIGPGFEETDVVWEYGTSPCSTGTCTKVPATDTVNGLPAVPIQILLTDLEAGTKYYFRAVADNPFGSDIGPEKNFTTFPFVDLTVDPCGNALARKQTGTAGMLDCRAYELVSADFTGGYDVISDLAPGHEPFEGYPDAPDKALYAVRDGGIPGTGNPTNRGPDPYVASRGADGWATKYVGIPADGTPSIDPFASSLLDADAGLSTFAFGGPDICEPCFGDGSSGIPVRMPDGSLVQGMAGSLPQTAGAPEGTVRDSMSSDGRHLVFGSTAKYEPAGNSNGDVTIYDRNLFTGTTQVASTLPSGATMTGPGIGQLDISDDGSRIIVGQKVGAPDASGNQSWKLYMHLDGSASSVELAPGTTTGVLYLGMAADGSRVFYSTAEQLVAGDTDSSVDIYEAVVSAPGALTPQLVSVASSGVPSNSDACEPVGVPSSWNAVSGDGDCNAVGLAGGAGVAGDGTVYFFSPEQLVPGEGSAGEGNLFVVQPDGQPEFVATLDSSAGTTPPPDDHPVENPALITGLSNPSSLEVDQQSGDIYVSEPGFFGQVKRFTATGAPANFTEGPGAGTNVLPESLLGEAYYSQIAVDSAPSSPLSGALYTTKLGLGVDVYSPTGAKLGSLSGFEFACGVGVDPTTGVVYIADPFTGSGRIWRFAPTSAPSPGVSNANYTVTSIATEFSSESGAMCQIAADDGTIYVSGMPFGPIQAFDDSQFGPGAPLREGPEVEDKGSVPPSQTMAVDPSTGELYVNNGSKIVIFDSAHRKVKDFAQGNVTFFAGVAVNGGEGAGQAARAHHAYAVKGSTVVEYGVEPDVYQPVDDPAIVHGVNDNEVHRWSDFQTTANGDFALLSSEQPLTPEYDNAGFRMVHRYDVENRELSCLSCLSIGAPPGADAGLPTHGSGLTDDGRGFFNSEDALVLRDQNGKKDAYEWNNGDVSLISTGFSATPSSLLTVTSDGKNAFFFTRETLVSRDRNGQAMKLYDAREDGGFFVLPKSPPCAASDECHGPSTQAAPPPPIGTFRGSRGQHTGGRKKCKKGFVKKRGKCVRKRHKGKKRKGKKRKGKKRAAKNRAGGRR